MESTLRSLVNFSRDWISERAVT